ncbi:helix-turn-helix domain-containing protein [Bacillus badius]|uniref:Transcriptional regulator n=1 Tax=Bacillus badius TaxID=1455 RepID=A0ABR5ASF7_BACBA|nr:helix-turn-helix transcriptional regulator [Bacillus badius]KIL77692.1 Transcriptional regulator [Bacillus badius]MED4718248.1 helix-turn-helix transcriptional regulator [Bacillus badius]GLY11343.1 putative HTH-type transcriptional regulator YqaE [Bacillus badius]
MEPLLSERLIKLRKENKKTQQQVADFLGITRPAYTAYERGTRQPDYEILQKLADYYDTNTDYLLGRSDNPHPMSEDEREMLKFFRNPELNLFFREMKESPEEQLEELREIWEVIKRRNKKK